MPLISVIVPVYKVEKYLDRCVKSVLRQTFQDFEIILVDDGSPDACGAMCDAWAERDTRIRVVHKENGGMSSARNAGLALAKGEYISFIDSDDWVEPDMFSYLYNLLQTYPQAQMSQCGYCADREESYVEAQQSEVLELYDKNRIWEYFYRVRGETSNNAIWNKLYRREVLNGFSFVEGLKFEDVVACYEFFNHADCMIVSNRCLYHYFVNDSGVTRSGFTRQDLQYLEVWDWIVQWTEKDRPQYLFYAQMGRKRANFTILSKMRLRGYDKSDLLLREKAKELKFTLRRDLLELLAWHMPISRKVLLILLCI